VISSVLKIKTAVPPQRAEHLARPRLMQALEQGLVAASGSGIEDVSGPEPAAGAERAGGIGAETETAAAASGAPGTGEAETKAAAGDSAGLEAEAGAMSGAPAVSGPGGALGANAPAVAFARPLTLIVAPAGYGKTTLCRAWVNKRRGRSAWYSLDENDNEPDRFWLYLISALQTALPGVGHAALEALRASSGTGPGAREGAAGGALLVSLLNDLFAADEPVILVLDDYHVIEETAIHETMLFFLESLPPTVHVAVASRTEPPWPLSRWRGRGLVREIRQAQLAFRKAETVELFRDVKGIELGDAELDGIHRMTEGWPAGMELAVAHRQLIGPDGADMNGGGGDGDAGAAGPSGEARAGRSGGAGGAEGRRLIFDYLTEEVLDRQPEAVREFLLRTSILQRFSTALCGAVTDGETPAAQTLARLQRDYLFVEPVDEDRTWYRYHPLFREVLEARLRERYPEGPAALHERAAEWFLKHGETAEAVRHFAGARRQDRVAEILDDRLEEVLESDGPQLLVRCLEELPVAAVRRHPRLGAYRAWFSLVHRGIEHAERSLESDIDEGGEVSGMLAVVRAYTFIYRQEAQSALREAERALSLLPERRRFWRSNVAVISGDARLFAGNPKGAYSYYLEAHTINQKVGNHYLVLSTGFKAATALYYMGRLREAEELTTGLLRLADREGFARESRVGLLWTLLGELLREKSELDEAERCIERGLILSEPEKPSFAWNSLFKAALSFSRGDYGGALEAVARIEELHRNLGLPTFITFPAAVRKARIVAARGELLRAGELLAELGVSPQEPVRPGREPAFLVLCNAGIAGATVDVDRARTQLGVVESSAREGDYRALLLETLLARAALEAYAGARRAAERRTTEARALGAPLGYRQTFADYGLDPDAVCSPRREPSGTPTYAHAELVEPLTDRELDVLRLVAEGLSNQEISERLFVSPGTVKWHTSNIYGKLGAAGRTAAVALARRLELIPGWG